jgi:hypothetical protein
MNRPVAVSAASIDAVKAAHATVIHDRKDLRPTAGFFAGAPAGFAAAGFGGGGAVAVGAVDSSLLINEVSRGN